MKKFTFFFAIIFFSINYISAQNISEYLSDGKYFNQNKYYNKAIESYNKALQINNKSEEAYLGRGSVYLQINNFDSAKIDFEKTIEINPRNNNAYFNLGKYYFYSKNYDKAIINYKKAITFNPDTAIYFLALAETYRTKKNSDSAFFFYNQAIVIQSNYSDVYYYKASYENELGLKDDAYSDVEKGLKIKPLDIYLLTLKAYLLMADEYYEKALDVCNLILYDNPLYVPAMEIRAQCYFVNNELEKATDDAEFCYSQDSSNIQNIIVLSWSYYYLLNYTKSLEYATKGQQLIPDYPDFYSIIGFSHFFSKEYDLAYREFEKAIWQEPEKHDFYEYKIQSKLLSNTNQDVFTENMIFKDLNQSNFENMDLWLQDSDNKYFYNNILQKFKLDNTSLSLDEYFMLYYGETLQKSYLPYQKTDLKKLISEQFALGKYEECIKIGEEIINDSPTLLDAYQYIAYSYLHLKNYQKYEEYLFPYLGFISAISASGMGDSYDSPFVVTSVTDEYSVLYYWNDHPVSHKFIVNKKHKFDVFLVQNQKDENKEIYFNVEKPYNTLKNIFNKKIKSSNKKVNSKQSKKYK